VCSGCSGRAQAGAQDVLRHAQECSPSAQVKAAAAHVQTLKQNQRKKKLSITLVVVIVNGRLLPLRPHRPPPELALSALLLPSTSNHQSCAIVSWYPLLCSSTLSTSADPGSSPRSLLPHSVAGQRQAKRSNILPHNTSSDPSRAAQHIDHIFAAQLV
jgi:hypothetical protein